MELKKVDCVKEAQTLFKLDNLAFHRDFDLPSRNIQEQIDYLQGSEVYILYDNLEPMGFFAFKEDEEGVELMAIAVNPKMQGKGYGKIMMKKILKLTNGKGIRLVTHPRNRDAIIFYLKSGFEIYGWKDNYYGDGKPRLLLKRI